MPLHALFSPALSLTAVAASSQKRLFETVARRVAAEYSMLDADRLFDALIARERLGSTGLGDGVAVPHCRLAGLECAATGALVQLATPLDFDAADRRPVDILAFLIVAEGADAAATQGHLDLLAALAARLGESRVRAALRAARSPVALCSALCGPP
ncbi:MAG: PTS sugar transporter subunit IIA [Cellvibrionales bacterium]|nr:PTS sugar transporter subunit IIA [Cellvibrionales bacterium]